MTLTREDLDRMREEVAATFDSGVSMDDLHTAWGLNTDALIEHAFEYALVSAPPDIRLWYTLTGSKSLLKNKMVDFMVGFNIGFKAALELETRRQSD